MTRSVFGRYWRLQILLFGLIFLSLLADAGAIKKVSGSVIVNGALADKYTSVLPGDTVTTGDGGEISFVVDHIAFHLYPSSSLMFRSEGVSITDIHLVKGQVLALFHEGSGLLTSEQLQAEVVSGNSALLLSTDAKGSTLLVSRGEAKLKAAGSSETLKGSDQRALQGGKVQKKLAKLDANQRKQLVYLASLLGL